VGHCDTAGQPGGGVQPGQDPGDRRGEGEDRPVDAEILAQLLAADYLPPVWMPDAGTNAVRRQVLRRAYIVRQRTRLKNQVHGILARNLVPRCPAADLFRIKGRAWLAAQDLPPDEQAPPARCCASWTSTARSWP
jgi:transposase